MFPEGPAVHCRQRRKPFSSSRFDGGRMRASTLTLFRSPKEDDDDDDEAAQAAAAAAGGAAAAGAGADAAALVSRTGTAAVAVGAPKSRRPSSVAPNMGEALLFSSIF